MKLYRKGSISGKVTENERNAKTTRADGYDLPVQGPN